MNKKWLNYHRCSRVVEIWGSGCWRCPSAGSGRCCSSRCRRGTCAAGTGSPPRAGTGRPGSCCGRPLSAKRTWSAPCSVSVCSPQHKSAQRLIFLLRISIAFPLQLNSIDFDWIRFGLDLHWIGFGRLSLYVQRFGNVGAFVSLTSFFQLNYL